MNWAGCLPPLKGRLGCPPAHSAQASLSGLGSKKPEKESRGNKRLLYLLIEFEWLFGLYMGYEICELEVKYELINVTQMVEKSQGKVDNLCTYRSRAELKYILSIYSFNLLCNNFFFSEIQHQIKPVDLFYIEHLF